MEVDFGIPLKKPVILISAIQTHGVMHSSGPAQAATRCSVMNARKRVTPAKCSTFELIGNQFNLNERLIFTS